MQKLQKKSPSPSNLPTNKKLNESIAVLTY